MPIFQHTFEFVSKFQTFSLVMTLTPGKWKMAIVSTEFSGKQSPDIVSWFLVSDFFSHHWWSITLTFGHIIIMFVCLIVFFVLRTSTGQSKRKEILVSNDGTFDVKVLLRKSTQRAILMSWNPSNGKGASNCRSFEPKTSWDSNPQPLGFKLTGFEDFK